MSVLIEEELDNDLVFAVTVSTDGGTTWKSLGDLTIDAEKREGILTFKVTGSKARFKLTTSSATECFTISEVTYRVRARGLEINVD